MGAWDTGPFDNDGALDVLAEIRHGDFTFAGIDELFDDPEYLEVDGGQIAVALAALVQASRGKMDAPAGLGGAELESFAAMLTPERLDWLQAQLDRALADGESSELYELWEETDELASWLAVSRVRVTPSP